MTGSKHLSGQSIFEVILALAISAMVLTAIVTLTSKTVTTSANSKNKSQANRYASEAMEFARKWEDQNGWTAFKDQVIIDPLNTNSWCMASLDFNTSGECGSGIHIANSQFTRNLYATLETNSIKIEVKVTWLDETGTHETYTESYISNW